MASISTMLPDSCMVLRDGAQVTVVSSDIVPGDILYIKSGNKLPADVRFFEISSDAKFDRSILTGETLLTIELPNTPNIIPGESQPLQGTIDSTDDNYLETKCIGLQGTHCVIGSGLGIVVSTGDSTVFGKIAKMTNAPKTGLTPLEREVLNFVIIICSIMFLMIVIVIVVW